jgi:hypothetical protein
MTHESAYALSGDDCLHKLKEWQKQRPKEQLASFSVIHHGPHWYLEASWETR